MNNNNQGGYELDGYGASDNQRAGADNGDPFSTFERPKTLTGSSRRNFIRKVEKTSESIRY